MTTHRNAINKILLRNRKELCALESFIRSFILLTLSIVLRSCVYFHHWDTKNFYCSNVSRLHRSRTNLLNGKRKNENDIEIQQILALYWQSATFMTIRFKKPIIQNLCEEKIFLYAKLYSSKATRNEPTKKK